ncbi:MAG: NAD(P)/FAD-dependent oxidoreductase [Pseudonocardia sp.]|nr:NAD(P)/FAD-dependent oxidoreductase [Pseudonocardia sp.]
MTRPDDVLDVAVIGGGQAGLAMAWHLRRHGLRFAVLDAAPEVGATWRSRWDSLRLFTSARYDGLPGLRFPGAGDRYPTKDEVADYLRGYAAAFDLPVRLDSRVHSLTSCGDGYELGTARGRIRAQQVVVATGPFQVSSVPGLATGLDPAVTQLHSSDYRGPHQLPDGPVLVVGDGNSGRQIAAELATTRRVDLATSGTAAVVPQRPLGRDLFWWLTGLGLVTAPADSRIGRRMRARGELVVGTTDRMLRDTGVTLRPRLTAVDGLTGRFADGAMLALDTVVWATGFRRDHSWIDVPGALIDGRPVHERGVSPVPGLHFLGLPWQHSRGSALLGFVGHDAAHLTQRITASAATRRNHRRDDTSLRRSLEPSHSPARSTP